MGVSKFIYGDQIKFDITDTTATPETVLNGYTFHGANGEALVGNAEGGGGKYSIYFKLTNGGLLDFQLKYANIFFNSPISLKLENISGVYRMFSNSKNLYIKNLIFGNNVRCNQIFNGVDINYNYLHRLCNTLENNEIILKGSNIWATNFFQGASTSFVYDQHNNIDPPNINIDFGPNCKICRFFMGMGVGSICNANIFIYNIGTTNNYDFYTGMLPNGYMVYNANHCVNIFTKNPSFFTRVDDYSLIGQSFESSFWKRNGQGWDINGLSYSPIIHIIKM